MDGLFLACLMGICGLPESPPRLESPHGIDAIASTSLAEAAASRPERDGGGDLRHFAAGGLIEERPAPRKPSAAPQDVDPNNGKLSRADIVEVVRQNTLAVRRCYERGLVEDDTFSGTVQVAWKIQVDGRVSAVSLIDASKRNGTVEDCLLAEIMRWRFPSSSEPTAVGVYPFELDARLLTRHLARRSP